MKAKSKENSKKAPGVNKTILPAAQKKWHEMIRTQRRELERKIQSDELTLAVVHPDAAGIDYRQ